MKVAAFLIFIVVVVILCVIWSSQHRYALPLVHASCQKLPNPCAKIDCNKPDTKVIA